MKLAPIVLFTYNRPVLTKSTLESLYQNKLATESELFIYVDGPKQDATQKQIDNNNEVRKVIREKNWCKSVKIIESSENNGLAKSIIKGVTDIVNQYGKVIVIEDDVLLSPHFLNFMNDSLTLYNDNNKVLSIGSWSYFCPPEKINSSTYFFRFPDCKGWATWDRAWKLFEPDPNVAFRKLKNLNKLNDFNAGLPFPYFTNMLKDQIAGKINSWAIRWTATAIIYDKLSLFPAQTLSKDIGFVEDATHESSTEDYNKELIINLNPIILKTEEVIENTIAVGEWKSFYLRHFIPPLTLERSIREGIKMFVPDKFIQIYRDIRYKK